MTMWLLDSHVSKGVLSGSSTTGAIKGHHLQAYITLLGRIARDDRPTNAAACRIDLIPQGTQNHVKEIGIFHAVAIKTADNKLLKDTGRIDGD